MASTDPAPSRRDLEARTKKVLSIETSPTPENIAKCNQQNQSPLFSVIPPEIRNNIFALALLQYEDLTQPYPQHDHCHRPGHRARRIVATGLLLTCRRIWLEANHWPMEQAVHGFRFDRDRRPKWTGDYGFDDDDRFQEFMKRFSFAQRRQIKHIQVFAQLYWFEGALLDSYLWACLNDKLRNLETFTLTIRHGDWWNWESDSPLRFKEGRVREILCSPEASCISEFRLELETLEWKMGQLQPILNRLKALQINDSEEDNGIHWELIEPFEEITWSGPTNVGNEDRAIYAKHDKLDYRIVTVKWKRHDQLVEKVEQRWREEKSLLVLTDRGLTKSDVEDENETDTMHSWDDDENDLEEDDDDDYDSEEEDDDGYD